MGRWTCCLAVVGGRSLLEHWLEHAVVAKDVEIKEPGEEAREEEAS